MNRNGGSLRLVDYVICLLGAHAQTLNRLAALFGEEALIELLETAGDDERSEPYETETELDLLFNERPGAGPHEAGSAYAELEGAVHEMGLPAMLDFHLWAYPHYRALIENATPLHARLIDGDGDEMGRKLVDEAVNESKRWVHHLPIPPELGPRAESAAQIPWIKFRSEVLKKMGVRTLGAAPDRA